jgi:hypothetical protein
MGSPSLDPCFPIPTSPDQLRQRLGVMSICLVSLQRRRRPRVAGIKADDWKTKLLQRMVELRRQLSGLEPNTLQLRRVAAQCRGNRLRLAGSLAAPEQPPGLVDDVNRGVPVRNIEPNIVRHGRPQDLASGPSARPAPSLAEQAAGSRSAHVERFFAWINRNRRFAKNFEATIESVEAFLYAASSVMLLRRLAR